MSFSRRNQIYVAKFFIEKKLIVMKGAQYNLIRSQGSAVFKKKIW